jgi:mono/diheme cytochrome c family protein
MRRKSHVKGGKFMWTGRVSALVLAVAFLGGAPSAVAQAQTAPDISLPPGDAARGKAIFEGSKGNCRSCHRVSGVGSLYAPDLSSIGAPRGGGGGGGGGRGGGGGGGGAAAAGRGAPAPATPAQTAPRGAAPAQLPAVPGTAAGGGGQRGQGGQGGNAGGVPTPQQLAQSILEPNAVVSAQNRYVNLKMKDGKTITGKLLSIDTFYVQIFSSEEKLANISRENVREMTMASPMPSYKGKLTTQELADVVAYLMSLKGQ